MFMKLLDEQASGIGSAPRRSHLASFRQLPVRIGLALAIFSLVYVLIDIFALSSLGRIVVDMESDHDTIAAIYYSSSPRKVTFQEKRVKHLAVKANSRELLNFAFDNKVARAIRLDPGREAGVYRVYSLAPRSFYGEIKPIKPFLPEVVVEAGPGVTIAKKDGYLEIIAETDDPYVIFKQEIKAQNSFLLFLTPFLVALLVLAVRGDFKLTECAFWADTLKKSPSGGQNFDALDGMRGLAALFVLATHTGLAGCNSLGHVGIIFFFSLSGFLLSQSYAKDSSLILSASKVGNYYLRRLRRIVPMFYFILIVTYLFNDRIDDFIRSALFIQGNTIYWTVLQEIHFYIFLPALLLVNHLILRGNRVLIVGLLLTLGFCFNHGLISTYQIFGLGQKMSILAGLFLNGIMVSYLCRIDWVQNSRGLQRFFANPVVGCLLLAAIFGIEQLWAITHNGQVRNSSWLLWGNFNYLVAVLLVLLVLAPHSLPGKLFNALPLRIMGTVSYSFYLLHPICLKIVKVFAADYLGRALSSTSVFLFTLVLTFALSCVTYAYIEKPFLQMGRR